MRRENGTGTIYKIKDRKLRKPFKVIVVTGYSLDSGNPIRKVLGYYGKASEATEALNNYLKNKNITKAVVVGGLSDYIANEVISK